MRQLVYVSRALQAFAEADLLDLGGRAGSANRRLGITGLLLFDGSRFIQALEGEAAAVAIAVRRIEDDPRHAALEYVSDQPVAAREFDSWAMNFPQSQGMMPGTFVAGVKANVADVRKSSLQALFIGFAALSSASAAGRDPRA